MERPVTRSVPSPAVWLSLAPLGELLSEVAQLVSALEGGCATAAFVGRFYTRGWAASHSNPQPPGVLGLGRYSSGTSLSAFALPSWA